MTTRAAAVPLERLTTEQVVELSEVVADPGPIALYHQHVHQSPGIFVVPVPCRVGLVVSSERVLATMLREEITWHPAYAVEIMPDGMVRFVVDGQRGFGWVHKRRVRWGR